MSEFRGGTNRVAGRRRRAAVLVLVALGFLLVPVSARADGASCRDVYFPVTLVALPQTMHGTLCVPAGGANTVQVLIPGGTYNSSYWDIGYQPEIRSYRLAMNNAGYATLALDRLGTGRSSTPPSAVLTTVTEATVVHQVIQAVRSGAQGPRFGKVILAGHSFGSGTASIEAATFHDVDAVLVTGLAHRLNLAGTAAVFAATYPAVLDPRFAAGGYDVGYLTTVPDSRYSIFHAPGPRVAGAIAFDEATKDTSAYEQAADLFPIGIISPYSLLIDKPVMVVLGQDTVFCGLLATNCSSAAGIRNSELPYYAAATDLTTYALQGYGHAINYAPNAPDYFRAVVAWADRTVGR
ncbi:alpha/beta hydrolase [Amycolatopsis sp.]|uniref:alpha/beta hydrolase n=1 Tax=Amycolatopsis sp. TaxID=37632 RepID=UPI002D802E99|nr:alpha/beta hydrolase [Amycolatopsis sp.]HET6704516.1 alpha/beta hydrolase [Amycolatopsis sp.]